MNYIEKSALEVNGIAWLEKFLSFHDGFIAGDGNGNGGWD